MSRKLGERIILRDGNTEIAVSVERVGRRYIRIGVEAPQRVAIAREEVDRVHKRIARRTA